MKITKRERKRRTRQALADRAIRVLAAQGNVIDGAPPLEFTVADVTRIEVKEITRVKKDMWDIWGNLQPQRVIIIHATGYPHGAIQLRLNADDEEVLRLNDPQPGCDAAVSIWKAFVNAWRLGHPPTPDPPVRADDLILEYAEEYESVWKNNAATRRKGY